MKADAGSEAEHTLTIECARAAGVVLAFASLAACSEGPSEAPGPTVSAASAGQTEEAPAIAQRIATTEPQRQPSRFDGWRVMRLVGPTFFEPSPEAEMFAALLPEGASFPQQLAVESAEGEFWTDEVQHMRFDAHLVPIARYAEERVEVGRRVVVFAGIRGTTRLRLHATREREASEFPIEGTLELPPLPTFEVLEHGLVHVGAAPWIMLRVQADNTAPRECPPNLATQATNVNGTTIQPIDCITTDASGQPLDVAGVTRRTLVVCAPESSPGLRFLDVLGEQRVLLPERVEHSSVPDAAILACVARFHGTR